MAESLREVDRTDVKWIPKFGLFTSQLIRNSMYWSSCFEISDFFLNPISDRIEHHLRSLTGIYTGNNGKGVRSM
jgi:hypothetical protein